MASINQQDLNVRLQLAGCKFSDLAQRFNKDLLYGRKCVTENRTDLMLLNVYLEILECYKLDKPEVESVGSFQITTLSIGYTLEIFVNGVSITGVQTSVTTNRNTTMHALVSIINSYQSVYTASLDTTNDLYKVVLGPNSGHSSIDVLTNSYKDSVDFSDSVFNAIKKFSLFNKNH